MEKKYCHFPLPSRHFLEADFFLFKSVLEMRLYLLLAPVFPLMCLCFVIPFDVLLLATVGRSASLQTAHHPQSFSPPLTVLSNYFWMPKHLQYYWQTISRCPSISTTIVKLFLDAQASLPLLSNYFQRGKYLQHLPDPRVAVPEPLQSLSRPWCIFLAFRVC